MLDMYGDLNCFALPFLTPKLTSGGVVAVVAVVVGSSRR